jgi:TonB family protein
MSGMVSIFTVATILVTTVPDAEATQSEGVRISRDTVPVFFEHQVNESVQVLGWKAPTYPPKLKADRVEGLVVLEFIVDTAGKMEEKSIKVVRSTNPQFTAAVRSTLHTAQFAPATLNDKRVRQVVHQEFRFQLPRGDK